MKQGTEHAYVKDSGGARMGQMLQRIELLPQTSNSKGDFSQ